MSTSSTAVRGHLFGGKCPSNDRVRDCAVVRGLAPLVIHPLQDANLRRPAKTMDTQPPPQQRHEMRLSQIKAMQEHHAAGAAAEAAAVRARRSALLSGKCAPCAPAAPSLHKADAGYGMRCEFGAQPVAIAGGRVLSSTCGAIQWQHVGSRGNSKDGVPSGLQLEPERQMGECAIDPYCALGVSPDAGDSEIRARYLQLAKQCELRPGDSEQQRELELLSGCFTILSDPFLRAQYDRGEHELTNNQYVLERPPGQPVRTGSADSSDQDAPPHEDQTERGQWARDVYHWTRWWRSPENENQAAGGGCREPGSGSRQRRGSYGSDSSVVSHGSSVGGGSSTEPGASGRRPSLEGTPPRIRPGERRRGSVGSLSSAGSAQRSTELLPSGGAPLSPCDGPAAELLLAPPATPPPVVVSETVDIGRLPLRPPPVLR
jgi:curved DNA-binding protein CbpA